MKTVRPAEEDAALAEQVTHPAGEQQQAAEGDQVGVDDPGEVALREAEAVLDRRAGRRSRSSRRGRSSASRRRGRRARASAAVGLGGHLARLLSSVPGIAHPSRWFKKTTTYL